MKKLNLFFLVLGPVMVFSQSFQPAGNNQNLKSDNWINHNATNRSVPTGTLVWSQLPVCDGYGFAHSSQLDPVGGFDFRVADDFLFTSYPGSIGAVRWWIEWYNPNSYEQPTSFHIYLYDNNNCLPGNLLAQWNIPFDQAHEAETCDLGGYISMEYWATLTPAFIPSVNEHYWICIQPESTIPPQTGIPEAGTRTLCNAAQQYLAPYAPLYNRDAAFELYSTESVPVSNWALLAGGVLIAAAIFFRYRRSL